MNSNNSKYLSSLINRIFKEIADINVLETSLLFKKVLDVYMEGNVENDKIVAAIKKSLLLNVKEEDPSPFNPTYGLHSTLIDIAYFLPGDLVKLFTGCFYLMNKRLHVKLMTFLFTKEQYWEDNADRMLAAMYSYSPDDDFDILIIRDKMLKKLLKYDGCLKTLQIIANGTSELVESASNTFYHSFIPKAASFYFSFPKSFPIKDLLNNINEHITFKNVEYHIIQFNALMTPQKQLYHLVALYLSNRCSTCNKIIWGFTAYASKNSICHLNCIYDPKSRLTDVDSDNFGRVYDKLLNKTVSYSDNETSLIIDLLVLQYILLVRSNEYTELQQRLYDGIEHFKGLDKSTKTLFFSSSLITYPLYHPFNRKYFDDGAVPLQKLSSFYSELKRKVIQQHVVDLLILHGYLKLKSDEIQLEIPVFGIDDAVDSLLCLAICNALKSSNQYANAVGWWLIQQRVHPICFENIKNKIVPSIKDWYKHTSHSLNDNDYFEFMNRYKLTSDVFKPHKQIDTTSMIYLLNSDKPFDAKLYFKPIKHPKVPFIFTLDDAGKKLLGDLLQFINRDPEVTFRLNQQLFQQRINVSLTWLTLMTRILLPKNALIVSELFLLHIRVEEHCALNRIKPIVDWISKHYNSSFQVVYLKIFATLLGCSTDFSSMEFTPLKPRKTPILTIDMAIPSLNKLKDGPITGESLILITKIAQVYVEVDPFPNFLKSILNHLWNHLEFKDIELNLEYCKCISFLIQNCQSSQFLQPPVELKHIDHISYFMDYFCFIPPHEHVDYTLVVVFCLFYLHEGIFHKNVLIRQACKAILERKSILKEWGPVLDPLFNKMSQQKCAKYTQSIATLSQIVQVRFFSLTRLLDVLGKASFDYFNNKTVNSEYIISLFKLMCLECCNADCSDPEIVIIKYLIAVLLGFQQVKIKELQLLIGPYKPIVFTDTVLECMQWLLDRQTEITSKQRFLQIEISLLLINCASTHLKDIKNLLDLKLWLNTIYICLYYNMSTIPMTHLEQLFQQLIDISKYSKDENKEYCMYILQYMIEYNDIFYQNHSESLLSIAYSCIHQLKVNFKDTLGKRGAIFLHFLLLQHTSGFYTLLFKENELITYLQIIYDSESKEVKYEQESLPWDDLQLEFYNHVLLYGIDSLQDVQDHFSQFMRISKNNYTQQHSQELVRIIDDILKKSSSVRVSDDCAGYFLESLSVFVEKHGYISTLILENLRFNLDSFLCSFNGCTANAIHFFDILQEKDQDLFEFTLITIYKSKLNKKVQNRAFSQDLLKYIDHIETVQMIPVHLEEVMENAFDDKDYLIIGHLATVLQPQDTIQLNKFSTNRVFKAIIVLLYCGFKSHQFHYISLLSQCSMDIISIVTSLNANSTHQQSSKQSLLIQLFLIFKLTGFITQHCLTTDELLLQDLMRFEYAIWNGVADSIKELILNDVVLKSGIDLFEFTMKCNAKVNCLIADGLYTMINNKIDEKNDNFKKWTQFKQIYDSNSVNLPRSSLELFMRLEQEINQL